jgi:hypothetical protein
MNSTLPAALALALLVSPPDATAQVATAQIPASVKTGLQITIVGDDGQRVEGRVDAVTEHAVRVSVRKAIEEISIDRIVRIERRDSLKNGALIGLTLGAVGGLIGGAMEDRDRAARMIAGAVGNGLIWMAFGIGIDALNDNRQVLYERGGVQTRIGLALGRDTKSAAVSLTW